MPSPNPTDSSDSPEWAEVQEDESSPTESDFMTGPVITFVRTERKEVRYFIHWHHLRLLIVLTLHSGERHKTEKHNEHTGTARMSK